jgi:hypothetical protein
MEAVGDLSPRALAAALAFLDDYEPPEEGLLGPVGGPGDAQAAQEVLGLQESELRGLLDAQSSDLSVCAAGDPFVGRGNPAAWPVPQTSEHAGTGTIGQVADPPVPPVATTSRTATAGSHPPKKPRTYNPNRARDQQRKELAGLREQVPRLEQVLARLKWKARRSKRAGPGEELRALAARGGDAWQEVAACRRELREQAELENARLRAIVGRQIEIAKRMQQILQTRHRYQASLAHPLGLLPLLTLDL